MKTQGHVRVDDEDEVLDLVVQRRRDTDTALNLLRRLLPR